MLKPLGDRVVLKVEEKEQTVEVLSSQVRARPIQKQLKWLPLVKVCVP